MFDAILVRRNSAVGAGALDLGRLAETMLFYRTVRLCLTRGSLRQLIDKCGPELALEIVESSNIRATYLDVDTAVNGIDVGTSRERHRPVTFKILDGPSWERAYEDTVISFFRDATGKSGRGRRLANRFMTHVHVHQATDDLLDAAQADWQNELFVRRAVSEALAEYVPSYPGIDSVQAVLRPQGDGYFTLESNLDWERLQQAYERRGDLETFTVNYLLSEMVDMRHDLYLAATFGSGIAQNSLGARLTRSMCADLTAAVDKQQAAIDQFQDFIVHGVSDVAGVINSGRCSFSDFLKVFRKAEHFRNWLDSQSPDEDLVRSYTKEATKDSRFASGPVKELRWMLPVATGFLIFLPGVIPPAVAGSLTIIDRFLIEHLAKGWRPSSFIENELRPTVNQ